MRGDHTRQRSVPIIIRVRALDAEHLDKMAREGGHESRNQLVLALIEAIIIDDKHEHGEAAA